MKANENYPKGTMNLTNRRGVVETKQIKKITRTRRN